jgi:hypothetical protein
VTSGSPSNVALEVFVAVHLTALQAKRTRPLTQVSAAESKKGTGVAIPLAV